MISIYLLGLTENKVQLARNAIDRFQISLGNLALPIVAKGANLFSDAVNNLTGKIPALTDKIKEVYGYVKDKLAAAFESAKPAIEWVFTEGLPKVTELFYEVLDGATQVYNFINDNWSLIGPIIEGIAVGIGAYKLAMLGMKAVTAIATGIQWAMTAAQWALNTAMNANPIGLICIAIAALVAVALLVIKNWDKIKTFFIGLWEKLVEIFGNIGEWFKDKFTKAKEAILGVFSSVAAWFDTNVVTPIMYFFIPLINFLVGLFSIIWSGICAVWNVVAGWFDANVIQPLVQFFSGLWQSITSFFQSAWDGVVAVWTAVAGWFDANVIQPVVAFFTQLGADIVTFFQTGWDGIVAIWTIVSTWFNDNVIQPIVGLFTGLIDEIKGIGEKISTKLEEMFTKPIDWIMEKWEGIKNFFSGLLGTADEITQKGAAITGMTVKTSARTSVPHYATGSNYTPSTFIAGEKGPELITNASGSKVFTAAETGNIMNNLSRYDNLGLNGWSPDGGPEDASRGRTVSAGGSRSEITIDMQYNPSIVIEGGGANAKEIKRLVAQAIMDGGDYIRRMIQEVLDAERSRKERTSNA